MSRTYSRGVVLVLAVFFPLAASGADTWKVKNNLRKDFRLEIRSSGGGEATAYELKKGETVAIALGEDAHTLVTELLQGENKQRQESDEVNLKEIAGDEVTLLKDIRSPIDIRMPNSDEIYQAMPDYPYSKKYEALVDDVRQSRWSGTYNGRMGSLRLRGDKGNADDNTKLNKIQYVPSETQLVVAGQWEHKDQNGEFILIIDRKNPKQLKGFYRVDGEQWSSGTARRNN